METEYREADRGCFASMALAAVIDRRPAHAEPYHAPSTGKDFTTDLGKYTAATTCSDSVETYIANVSHSGFHEQRAMLSKRALTARTVKTLASVSEESSSCKGNVKQMRKHISAYNRYSSVPEAVLLTADSTRSDMAAKIGFECSERI